ncbi:MAG: hypothetical protein KDE33_06660 [Bacteroidetes bacterium]|nr:hypothetical protein [Bacteroidota bacterium]MCB9227972.1 hypothetical protein [Chitinophagales bacterium]
MKNIILVSSLILLFSSCKTLVPFTENLKVENKWSDNELKSIQFYNSNTIILHRELNNNETGIESGKIKIIDGKEVEEIIIQAKTPGVVTSLPSNKVAISFELDDSHFLVFGIDPKRNNRYYLRLKEKYNPNTGAKVTYNNKVYQISNGSLNSFLMVNLKKINKEQRNLRVAKGRKL